MSLTCFPFEYRFAFILNCESSWEKQKNSLSHRRIKFSSDTPDLVPLTLFVMSLIPLQYDYTL